MARRTLFVITVSLLLASTAQASDWVLKKSSGFSTPGQGQKAKNGLPDGYAAKISRGDIASAWYTQPTRRYRHAILGDDIEAGGLKVSLRNGKTVELSLPENLVFEDRTPRLHDLDGDGKVEVITLLASNSQGAAISVYGMSNGKLKQIDQTPFIGRSNRWRNVAGIADYNGDGALEIAEVVTPHIGGTLRFWSWKKRRMKLAGSARYFSNHAIGAREQRLSATADFNGDGLPDLAVPGGSRDTLHLMGFVKGRKLAEIAQTRLPSAISHPILRLRGKVGVKVKLRDGSVWSYQRN